MNEEDPPEGTRRYFGVDLLIAHPTMTPAEITSELGIEAQFAHRVGDQRRTPKGTLLKGAYQETRWRHSARHERTDQHFAHQITALVNLVLPHREFFHRLRATGGRADVIVKFLGGAYFGDNVPVETLAKMSDLQLELGIESFAVVQS